MKIKWHNRSIKYTNEEIEIAIKAMQESLPLTQGKYLELFESKFEKYLSVARATKIHHIHVSYFTSLYTGNRKTLT